jgi:tape measure domain-containing protein
MEIARLQIVLDILASRRAVNELQADLFRLDQVAKSVGRRMSDSVNTAFQGMTQQSRAAAAAVQQFGQQAQQATRNAASGAQNVATQMGGIERMLGNLGRRFVGVFGALQFARLGREAVQAAIDFERIENVLKLVTDTSGEAALQFSFLQRESQRIGISFRDTADRFARFEAAARGTGVSTLQLKETFIAVAEAGRRFGLTTHDQQRIFLALEQMVSKGVVSMEELRRQLGDALPGAFQIAERSMGMTGREFNKLVESGNLMTKDFLGPFTKELAKMAPAGESVAQTAAEINRLKNAWDAFLASAGRQIPVKAAAQMGTGLLEMLTPNTARQEELKGIRRTMAASGLDLANVRKFPDDRSVDKAISENQILNAAKLDAQAEAEMQRREQIRERMFGGTQRLRELGTQTFESFVQKNRQPNEEETKKFQREFESIRLRGLSGRQEIVASYDAEEKKVRGLGLAYAQTKQLLEALNEARRRELEDFDRKQEAADADKLSDAYRKNADMLSKFTVEGMEPAAAAAAKVNEEFRKQYEQLYEPDEIGIDVTDTISKLNEARSRQLALVAAKRNRAGFTGESVSELRAGIRAGESGLMTAEDADAFDEISRSIQDRSAELARRMKADAVTVQEAWSVGWEAQSKSFGSFSERVAEAGAGVSESLDRNFTDAFTAMITGTKSASQAFSEMSTSIVSDLVRIMVQQMVVRTVLRAVSGIAGAGAGAGGGDTNADYAAFGPEGAQHFGGSAGDFSSRRGGTDRRIFVGATRYHSGGVAGDEIPVIATRNEAMIPDKLLGPIGKMISGAQRQPQKVEIYNGVDETALTDHLMRNPDIIVNLIGRKKTAIRQVLA